MNVTIDGDLCIGCGVCVGDCDAVFEMGDDGKAHVKHQPDASEEAGAKQAAADCPVSCISVS